MLFRSPLYFVKKIEKAVACAQVQGEVRPPLELILEVTVILGLAQAVDWQGTIQSRRTHLVFVERREGGICDCSSFGVPLVHLNASNLNADFERVPVFDPRRVVNVGEGVAGADANSVVIQTGKTGNRDYVGYPRLIDVVSVRGAAIKTELQLVHQGR